MHTFLKTYQEFPKPLTLPRNTQTRKSRFYSRAYAVLDLRCFRLPEPPTILREVLAVQGELHEDLQDTRHFGRANGRALRIRIGFGGS